ncbi:MAG: DUF3592 domain-containing protein [Prosthecobacter sp.]
MRARDWEPADAVIEKAPIQTIPNREGDKHKPVLGFRYQHRGAEHVGTRHSFVGTDTILDATGQEHVRDNLALGKIVRCWVNPADPAEAVLDRSLPGQVLLGLLLSVPFMTVGIFGLGILDRSRLRDLFFKRRKAQMTRLVADGRLPEWVLLPFTAEESPSQPGDVALRIAADDRLPQALEMTLLNFFWNGLVGAFLCWDVGIILSGERWPGLLLALFLLPFIVVGMSMLWNAVKLWRLYWRAGWVAALRPAPGLGGGEVSFCWAWLDSDSQRQARPPEAVIRIVGQAAAWDAESDSPRRVAGRKRRTKLSDRNAVQQAELELAAVEVPVVNAAREIPLHLPAIPPPRLELAKTGQWTPVTTWGGWWQLEVTYRDGAMELVDLTKPERHADGGVVCGNEPA